MKYFLQILTCLCLIMFFGCRNTHPEEKNITYSQYSQVPQYIKAYIDSISAEKFLIAEPGEPWDAGCSRIGDRPFRQFISAEKTPDFFSMKFWVGGFIIDKQKITLWLKDTQITRHSTTAIKNEL